MDFTADTMDELEEANDEHWPGDGDAVELVREWCAGFDQWCEIMGYVLDPSEGLTVANDSTLNYGKSYFRGIPCYWVDHSRIEYIWVDREYLKLVDEMMERASKTMTGRVDCSKPNLSAKPRSHAMHTHDDLPTEHMTPAEKAKNRAMAKKPPDYSMGCWAPPPQPCSLCKDGTTECNHLRQEGKAQAFNQDMVARGMSSQGISHSSQEMREHAKHSGIAFFAISQQPRVAGALHNLSKEEAERYIAEYKKKYPQLEEALKLIQERGVTLDTEKIQELLDANPPGDGPGLKEIAKTLATGFGDDPFAMRVIPIAISMSDMDKWGCPYCGYCQGSIPAVAEGTILWVCVDCQRGCHTLVDGLEMSTIAHLADIYPQLSPHPREGTPKRTERRVTNNHDQDSDSQDSG